MTDIAPPSAATPDLHAAIMNLQIAEQDEAIEYTTMRSAYRHGHHDARHAAAELVDASAVAPQSVSVPEHDRADFIMRIVQGVAEMPDRDSPEDQPEMMLVTSEELRAIIAEAFENADENESLAAPAASLSQPQAEDDYMLLESVEPDGVEWGVSFNGSNPQPEDYIACKDKDSAVRLFDKLSASLVSALPQQGEGSIDTSEFRKKLSDYNQAYITTDQFVAYIDSARLARTAAPSVKQLTTQLQDYENHWTIAEQNSFAVFLARFPNESSEGIISLGDAWKAGRAFEAEAPAPSESQTIQTDLPTRLRDMARDSDAPCPKREDILAAADEIDRLTALAKNGGMA